MPSRKLNIILLMTDQHRIDHVSYHRQGKMKTPNIDRIAESVGFTNCISVNPVCTPARTALLTGKYTHQIGMTAMSGDLALQHPTYPRALQENGYTTFGIGKFHWLQGWKFGAPARQGHDLVALKDSMKAYGFDHIWEASGKQLVSRNYCDYAEFLDRQGLLQAYREFNERSGKNTKDPERLSFTGEPFPFGEDNYMDIVIGRHIVEAIESRPKDRPFFIYGSFVGPHPPYDPPQSYLDLVPNEEIDDFITDEERPLSEEAKTRIYRLRRAYKAMIAVIDDQIGRILRKLEEEQLLEDTLILFTSDHGEMMGDHGRMQKQSPYRQSATVPAAIRHPDHLHRIVNSTPVELIDLAATILDAAGVNPKTALSLDWPLFNNIVPCRSLMPIVESRMERVRDFAFSECRGHWQMIQTERWKYVRGLKYDDPDKVPEQFYDLVEDPNECHNVIDEPSRKDEIEWCRKRRDFVMDRTPPAQLRWAPVIGHEELKAR